MRILEGTLTFLKGLPALSHDKGNLYFHNIDVEFELRIPGQNILGRPIQSERPFASFDSLESSEKAWLALMDSCHQERSATLIFKKGFSGCAC